MVNTLIESLNKQIDFWVKKRRQATISICDLEKELQEEEKKHKHNNEVKWKCVSFLVV